jgi:hypothetical protein
LVLQTLDPSPHPSQNEEEVELDNHPLEPNGPKDSSPTPNHLGFVDPSDVSRSLRSMFTPTSSLQAEVTVPNLASSLHAPPLDNENTPAPRKIPDLSSEKFSGAEFSPTPASITPQFNPPPGSRLLAFGTRTPSAISTICTKPETSLIMTTHDANGLHSQTSARQATNLSTNDQRGSMHSEELPTEPAFNQGHSHAEFTHTQEGVYPFVNHSHTSLENSQRMGPFTRHSDSLHQPIESTLYSGLGDPSIPTGSSLSQTVDLINDAGAISHSTGKGSRFARFFGGKTREGPTPTPIVVRPSDIDQKQGSNDFDRLIGKVNGDRAIDDIFTMLNSSSQVSRYRLTCHN